MSFIRHDSEAKRDKKKMFDGDGEVRMLSILNGNDEMYGKGRIFTITTLKPGCEVGWHIHKGDGETYYILKGQAQYNDNGKLTTLVPGDTAFVDDGEGHSIKNVGTEDLEFVALILYK